MSEPFYNRSYAKIDLDAIESNFNGLKECCKPGVKCMAVVKANAYGHGAVPVARRLEPLADYFAVACLAEAVELREAGIEKPILILSNTPSDCYSILIENGVTATLYSAEEAKLLSQKAQSLGKRVKVHVAVDTGMGRIGFSPSAESADVIAEISRLPGIELEGIFSHYACADCIDKADADCQTERFEEILGMLSERGVFIPIRHIANSAASMEMDSDYDMCRFGIALYGLYPSDEMDRDNVELKPAMQVFSVVNHVKTVEKGDKIGYGHIYTASSSRRIATVAIGYADGFNRCLTGVGYVLIHGKRAPIVGKVCMDQIMVDVSEIEAVAVGDTVTVMGASEDAFLSAEEFGAMCHSFNYEVVCTFMPRVQRLY